MKKVLCLLLCVAMLAACCCVTAAAEPKKCSIGVALYQDGGPAPTSVKAFLAMVGEKLNCEFKYTVLSSFDQGVNVTKIQELIASGVDGIICTMDMGMTEIIEECEYAGVYLAGFLADYDDSFKNNYDRVVKNPYFLGTVADGAVSAEVYTESVTGRNFFNSLKEYNETHPDAPLTHVSMCSFPFWAFPQNNFSIQLFTELVEEYNKTAAAPITIDPLNEETDILQFSPMDSTYFAKHPGIDAIISFAASKFAYGPMISAGVADSIKLFSSGYEDGDCENFGTNGTGTLQQEIVCASESIVYPLVLLINAINGVSFPDQPETPERVSASQLIMNSDADMEAFKNSMYLTGNAADSLFTAEEVYNMTALNPDATYAALVESLAHLTIEDVLAK